MGKFLELKLLDQVAYAVKISLSIANFPSKRLCHFTLPSMVYESEQCSLWASLVAQCSRSCLTMQETQVQSLGWEDPLEKEMATRSSILAWETPWTEEPGGLQFMGL